MSAAPPSRGRADLIRIIGRTSRRDKAFADTAAALCGFSRQEEEAAAPARPESIPSGKKTQPVVREAPPVKKESRRVVESSARFWRCVSVEVLPREAEAALYEVPEAYRRVRPLTPEDTGRRGEGPPPLEPLTRWARTWPGLRECLSVSRSTRAPDLGHVLPRIARGRSLNRIRRRQRHAWGSVICVMVDLSARLSLFQEDFATLLRRLSDPVGKQRLRLIPFDEAQGDPVDWLAQVPPGAHVLLLGDLGCLDRDPSRISGWVRLGRRLRERGVAPLALTPCPQDWIAAEVAEVWSVVEWDGGRFRPITGGAEESNRASVMAMAEAQAESLLRGLSISVRIERGLLRALRRAFRGTRLDAGVEYQAWNHPAMLGGKNYRCLDAERAVLLRDQLDAEDLSALQVVFQHLEAYHAYCSYSITQLELQLLDSVLRALGRDSAQDRARFAAPEDWEEGREFQRRVVRGMWDGGAHLPEPLARWADLQFRSLDQRMGSEEMQPTWALKEQVLGRGLDDVPEGLDREQIAWTLQRSAQESLFEFCYHPQAEGFIVRPFDPQDSVHAAQTGARPVPLFSFHTRDADVWITLGDPDAPVQRLRLPISPQGTSTVVVPLSEIDRITVTSGRERYGLVRERRHSAATRQGCDRYGLYLDLELGEKVPLRLRWIPPGRFRMGSPSNEEGRGNTEGPRHEVTLSSGYWLAEAPVTGAQWEAVMKPSVEVENEADLRVPVTEIDWAEGRDFCSELAQQFPELVFDYPSEAEWEYACRAGTESAFNDGLESTVPTGKDPALDRLAWYDENSGAVIHPVSEKAPNAWGLYDMHGNVWEWCLDDLRDYADRAEIDPHGALDGELRVFRGGGWGVDARNCRSAFRDWNRPGYRWNVLGFRLAAGQETGGVAAGRVSRPGPEATGRNPPVRGARRPRPWAQRFSRDRYGIRLEFDAFGTRFALRWIPRGRFMMGSPPEEAGRDRDETQHEVTLSKGFWLGATPVTQGQWQAVMGNNPSHFKGNQRPVEQVSWEDCAQFQAALNQALPDLNARFPSEAEWEYACRAGTESAFNDGSECTVPTGKDPALEQLGWYRKNSESETHLVMQKACNAWGLYDMHGNVWEWCSDWVGAYPPASQVDPRGPLNGENRVFRGGSLGNDAGYCRSAFRNGFHPGDRWNGLGFRLAAGQEPEKNERSREAEGADAPGVEPSAEMRKGGAADRGKGSKGAR